MVAGNIQQLQVAMNAAARLNSLTLADYTSFGRHFTLAANGFIRNVAEGKLM